MIRAVPDCIVRGHEPLIEGLQLRDPDDCHVLAREALQPWNIEAKTPDDFVLDQIDIADRMVWGCVQQIANSRSHPPETVEDVLGQLERAGLLRSAAALRQG